MTSVYNIYIYDIYISSSVFFKGSKKKFREEIALNFTIKLRRRRSFFVSGRDCFLG